jgi:ATP-dependent Zn protease
MVGENVPSVRLKCVGKLYTATSGLITTKPSGDSLTLGNNMGKGNTMIGKFKRGLSLSDEEIDRTAVHEAGHAVCSILYNLPLWRVEILPRRFLLSEPLAGRCLLTKSAQADPPYNWRADAHVCCAGYVAEALCLGTADRETAAPDFENVNRILAKPGRAVSLETICGETRELLKQHRSAIRAIANELLASKRLSGARVKEIIQEREPKIHGSKVHTLSRRQRQE